MFLIKIIASKRVIEIKFIIRQKITFIIIDSKSKKIDLRNVRKK